MPWLQGGCQDWLAGSASKDGLTMHGQPHIRITFCSVVICYACGKGNTQAHIVFSVSLSDKTSRLHIVAGLQL